MANALAAEKGWRAVQAPHMTAHGMPRTTVGVSDLELLPVVLWYVEPGREHEGDDFADPPLAYGFSAGVGGLQPCEAFETFVGYLAPGEGDAELESLLRRWQQQEDQEDQGQDES